MIFFSNLNCSSIVCSYRNSLTKFWRNSSAYFREKRLTKQQIFYQIYRLGRHRHSVFEHFGEPLIFHIQPCWPFLTPPWSPSGTRVAVASQTSNNDFCRTCFPTLERFMNSHFTWNLTSNIIYKSTRNYYNGGCQRRMRFRRKLKSPTDGDFSY